jgi:APA family basic amino acid/polyamine antiporter
MSIWKTKPLSVLLNEASEDEKGLKRTFFKIPSCSRVGAIIDGLIFLNWMLLLNMLDQQLHFHLF